MIFNSNFLNCILSNFVIFWVWNIVGIFHLYDLQEFLLFIRHVLINWCDLINQHVLIIQRNLIFDYSIFDVNFVSFIYWFQSQIFFAHFSLFHKQKMITLSTITKKINSRMIHETPDNIHIVALYEDWRRNTLLNAITSQQSC